MIGASSVRPEIVRHASPVAPCAAALCNRPGLALNHSTPESHRMQPTSDLPASSDSSGRISRAAWLALIAALLGWLFDGLEMGLFPLVARPALTDLLASADDSQIGLWIGILNAVFLVGAATGGVVFGWLGDRLGRVWAMTLSVFTYAIFMGLCGLSTSVYQMFLWRFIAALGMGGEWSLGVALVMEIWPNRSRAFTAGLIGAAANVGFLGIAFAGFFLGQVIDVMQGWLLGLGIPSDIVDRLVIDSHGKPTGWRLLMLLGALPAVLTFFIRLFVPESEKWLDAKRKGETSHWATQDMLAVVLGALGPMGMIYLWASDDIPLMPRLIGSAIGLLVALVGYTYPVFRYLQRCETQVVPGADAKSSLLGQTIGRMMLGACLSGIPLIGTWASLQNAPSWVDNLVQRQLEAVPESERLATMDIEAADAGDDADVAWTRYVASRRSEARSFTQISTAVGAIIGTILAALLGDLIGRRAAYTTLCLGSLGMSLLFFQTNVAYGAYYLATAFLAGALTASFYGWLPLYLPELFRTSVRATGQGFSFNFGRILAAVGALQTGALMRDFFKGDYSTACSIMSFVYLIGVAIIWFAPETRGKPLPE